MTNKQNDLVLSEMEDVAESDIIISSSEFSELKQELEGQGFDLFGYDARANDYLPYLCYLAQSERLGEFLEAVGTERFGLVGWLFEPLTKSWKLKALADFQSTFGLKQSQKQLALLYSKVAKACFEPEELVEAVKAFLDWKEKKEAEKTALNSKVVKAQKALNG